jgi:hypothetical protein
MDTFPTPALVGAWPEIVLANRYMGYTFKNDSKYRAIATSFFFVLFLLMLFLRSPSPSFEKNFPFLSLHLFSFCKHSHCFSPIASLSFFFICFHAAMSLSYLFYKNV